MFKRKVVENAVWSAVFAVAAMLVGCGGGGGSSIAPPPDGGGGGTVAGNAVSGTVARLTGASRAGGRSGSASEQETGKTVRLFVLDNAGNFVRTGVSSAADAVTDENGKFTLTGIPQSAADMAIRCMNCSFPAAIYVRGLAAKSTDVGEVTEETYIEQELLSQLLKEWSAAGEPKQPGDVDFEEIRGLIGLADIESFIDLTAKSNRPAMGDLARGLKERGDFEEAALEAFGQDLDAVLDATKGSVRGIVKALLEELHADLNRGLIAGRAAFEKEFAARLKALEAEGAVPDGFTEHFLEARALGAEALKNRLEAHPELEVQGEIEAMRAGSERERFRERLRLERDRFENLVERLIEFVDLLPELADIDEGEIAGRLENALASFNAQIEQADTQDEALELAESFRADIKEIFKEILQVMKITRSAFGLIIRDIETHEGVYVDSMEAAKQVDSPDERERAMRDAHERFQMELEGVLTGIRYLLAQTLADFASENPDAFEELALIFREAVLLISLGYFPLPEPAIGPPEPVPGTLLELKVSPEEAFVAVGEEVKFVALAISAETGQAVEVPVSWSVEPAGDPDCIRGDLEESAVCTASVPGSIGQNGLFRAQRAGEGFVAAFSKFESETGVAGALMARAHVIVESEAPAEVIVKLVVEPGSARDLIIGSETAFSADGITAEGEKVKVSPRWDVVSEPVVIENDELSADCGISAEGDPTDVSVGSDGQAGPGADCMPPVPIDPPAVGVINQDGLFTARNPGEGKVVARLYVGSDREPLAAKVPVSVLWPDKMWIEPQPKEEPILKVPAGESLLLRAFGSVKSGETFRLRNVLWHVMSVETAEDGDVSPVGCVLIEPDMPDETGVKEAPVDCLPAGVIHEDGLFLGMQPGLVSVFATLPSPTDKMWLLQSSILIEVTGEKPGAEGVDLYLPPKGIELSDWRPAEGDIVKITAAIVNKGSKIASGVKVAFYDNAEGLATVVSPIGEAAATGPIGPGGKVVVSVEWNTAGQMGENIIHVEALSAEEDVFPSDNHAMARVVVRCPEGLFVGPDGECTDDLSAAEIEFIVGERGGFAGVENKVLVGGQGSMEEIGSFGGRKCGEFGLSSGESGREAVEVVAKMLLDADFFSLEPCMDCDATDGADQFFYNFIVRIGDLQREVFFTEAPFDVIAEPWNAIQAARQGLSPELCGDDRPPESILCEEDRPEACILLYDPVCASDGYHYSNGCFACANPVVEWYARGECADGAGRSAARFNGFGR